MEHNVISMPALPAGKEVMAVRSSLSCGGVSLIKMLILGLVLAVITVSSVVFISETRSWIARLKFKKTIFVALIAAASVIYFLVAQKCCVGWGMSLLYSSFATSTYAAFVATFFFDRTITVEKKEEKKVTAGKKVVLRTCSLPAIIIILSYGTYCCGYGFSTAACVWLFGSIGVFAAIVIIGEIKFRSDKTERPRR